MDGVKKERYWTEDRKKEDCSEIFARMISGESLNRILKDKHLPHTKNFMNWLHKDDDLMSEYKTAQLLRAEVAIDEIMEIADNVEHDRTEETHETVEGTKVIRKWDGVKQRQRELRIATRKWVATKLLANTYGEKIQQEITTPEPVSVTVSIKHKNKDGN